MRKPLTIARTMPTILRLELDEVVVVLSERTNIPDMGTRAGVVDSTVSALGWNSVRGFHCCRWAIIECRRRRPAVSVSVEGIGEIVWVRGGDDGGDGGCQGAVAEDQWVRCKSDLFRNKLVLKLPTGHRTAGPAPQHF